MIDLEKKDTNEKFFKNELNTSNTTHVKLFSFDQFYIFVPVRDEPN